MRDAVGIVEEELHPPVRLLAVRLDEDVADGDSVTVQSGLPVIVPAKSLINLQGSTLDLPSNKAQGGLVIRNPNRPNPLAGVNLELSGTMAERSRNRPSASMRPGFSFPALPKRTSFMGCPFRGER